MSPYTYKIPYKVGTKSHNSILKNKKTSQKPSHTLAQSSITNTMTNCTDKICDTPTRY